MRNTIRLGTIFGIEIKLDYSWFFIFILVTWSLAGHYFPAHTPAGQVVPTGYWQVLPVSCSSDQS